MGRPWGLDCYPWFRSNELQTHRTDFYRLILVGKIKLFTPRKEKQHEKETQRAGF
jgi:hypothetical protein